MYFFHIFKCGSSEICIFKSFIQIVKHTDISTYLIISYRPTYPDALLLWRLRNSVCYHICFKHRKTLSLIHYSWYWEKICTDVIHGETTFDISLLSSMNNKWRFSLGVSKHPSLPQIDLTKSLAKWRLGIQTHHRQDVSLLQSQP